MQIKPNVDVCAACGASAARTEVRDVTTTQLFRGEELEVVAPVTLCQDCRFQFLGRGQLDELRRRTADAYRRKHGLLPSQEIVARRRALGFTQEQFAKYLRVGVASIKRWETWLVQEQGYDALIREKTDEDMDVYLIASAIRGLGKTAIVTGAYGKIVEGQEKVHEGISQLFGQLKADNPWRRFLMSTQTEPAVHWIETSAKKLLVSPIIDSLGVRLLETSAVRGECKTFTIKVRTKQHGVQSPRFAFENNPDVVSTAA